MLTHYPIICSFTHLFHLSRDSEQTANFLRVGNHKTLYCAPRKASKKVTYTAWRKKKPKQYQKASLSNFLNSKLAFYPICTVPMPPF